jgi:hypothetical protein
MGGHRIATEGPHVYVLAEKGHPGIVTRHCGGRNGDRGTAWLCGVRGADTARDCRSGAVRGYVIFASAASENHTVSVVQGGSSTTTGNGILTFQVNAARKAENV